MLSESQVKRPLTKEERRSKLLAVAVVTWSVPLIIAMITILTDILGKNPKSVVILGTVVDSKSQRPIENAIITVNYESKRVIETSNSDGKFRLALQVQDTTQAFDIEVKGFNYRAEKMTRKLTVDKPNYIEFVLAPLNKEM